MVENVLPIVLGISVLSLVVAALLAKHVLAQDAGKPEMRAISEAIREGAEAFLSRQYKTIGLLSIVAAAAIFGFYFVNREVKNIAEMGQGTAWKVTISFLTGALCSAIAGYIGMFVSIRANIRTAAAAMTSLNKALQTALRGPAAVAVHHDRDVGRHLVGIDVRQEAAHGADLASMGSDRIRRSRWYSANP